MKHRKIILICLLVLIFLIGALWLTAFIISRSENAMDMDGFMKSQMEHMEAPGLAAAITAPQGILWEGYYGTYDGEHPVSEDTVFSIASISKTMIATAAMQQWEQGRFALDDDINDYLDFKVSNPYHPGAVITFRHLMTHHSTIIDRDPVYMDMYTIKSGGGDSTWRLGEYMKEYLVPGGQFYEHGNFLDALPGESGEYSNYGTALLAYLVERISGQEFNEYCKEHIFHPLKMEHTYYLLRDIPKEEKEIASPFHEGAFLPHYGYPDYPAGSLRTTIRDLSRFAAFYLDPAASEAAILKPDTVALMFGKHAKIKMLEGDELGLVWTHMNWVFFNAVGHNGGDPGISTYLLLYLEKRFAIALFTNSDFQPTDPLYLFAFRSVLERLHAEGQNLSSADQSKYGRAAFSAPMRP